MSNEAYLYRTELGVLSVVPLVKEPLRSGEWSYTSFTKSFGYYMKPTDDPEQKRLVVLVYLLVCL